MDRLLPFTLSWDRLVADSFQLGVAYLLALPIGWNREREDHTAGLRTFPIVGVAACGFAMLGAEMQGTNADVSSRMLQGLIAGIGFVGAGAILRDKEGVTGTATAASIWNIGIVGAAVGLGMYHIAIILTAINLLTLKVLTPLKRRLDQKTTERRP